MTVAPQPTRDLGVQEAVSAILALLQPLTQGQTVPLGHSLGRVLAAAVRSPIDVPAQDNAAMDGYALASADLRSDVTTTLRLAGTLLAGSSNTPWPAHQQGECVRIMTGATLPPGLDTVVPHELCRVVADQVQIDAGILRPGDHRRLRGEDLQAGGVALPDGRVLRSSDVGLLASLGLATVSVRQRVRVALFSTGNELTQPGLPLPPGHVYDSNRFTLAAALERLGMEVVDLGSVPDDPEALDRTLVLAMQQADAVITTGGVSMGDADHTRAALARRGEMSFWKVAIRPGRPFAFGRLPRADGQAPAWLFALPGNPVAALVTFYALVRPALLHLAGAGPSEAAIPCLPVRTAQDIRKRPGRTEYLRAVLEPAPGGGQQARLTGPQGAGILSSMSQAQVLLVLGHERGPVEGGDWVDAWPLDGLV
jgi:molybdopterin molybdotransferase